MWLEFIREAVYKSLIIFLVYFAIPMDGTAQNEPTQGEGLYNFNGFTTRNSSFQPIHSSNFQDFNEIEQKTLFSTEEFFQTNDTNKLEFEETPIEPILLPERISFMENFLWGKNGLFRKVGLASELTVEQREKEMRWRRTFLTIHQTSGLVSWGLMLGTIIAGQLWLDRKLETPDWHKRFLYSTIATYSLTGLIAVITPPPLQRSKEFSTITVHKTLAWLHFLGMVATPLLGKAINSSNDYYKAARIHQTVGYITFSAYTIAMLSILLFR